MRYKHRWHAHMLPAVLLCPQAPIRFFAIAPLQVVFVEQANRIKCGPLYIKAETTPHQQRYRFCTHSRRTGVQPCLGLGRWHGRRHPGLGKPHQFTVIAEGRGRRRVRLRIGALLQTIKPVPLHSRIGIEPHHIVAGKPRHAAIHGANKPQVGRMAGVLNAALRRQRLQGLRQPRIRPSVVDHHHRMDTAVKRLRLQHTVYTLQRSLIPLEYRNQHHHRAQRGAGTGLCRRGIDPPGRRCILKVRHTPKGRQRATHQFRAILPLEKHGYLGKRPGQTHLKASAGR